MTTFIEGIHITELEGRIKAIVEDAVKTALEQKEPIKYYTIQEAAKRTNKSANTLYTHHCQGKLKAFKSGRQLRFSEAQLQAYLEGREYTDV